MVTTAIPCSRKIDRWGNYYKATQRVPFSSLAYEVLPLVARKGSFIDLGAGAMIDSAFFLREGFERGIAVDASKESVEYADRLRSSVGVGSRFQFANQRFSDFFAYEDPESADLVHANYALPFHGQDGFGELVRAIVRRIRVGGMFSGIFFGTEDGWKRSDPTIALVSKSQVESFFTGFDAVIEEREREGFVSGGENNPPDTRFPKHWHIIKAIARRTSPVL